MKAFEIDKILNPLCHDLMKTISHLNTSDNPVYLKAILEALLHISKQIEELRHGTKSKS